jgi:hypothetical protein
MRFVKIIMPLLLLGCSDPKILETEREIDSMMYEIDRETESIKSRSDSALSLLKEMHDKRNLVVKKNVLVKSKPDTVYIKEERIEPVLMMQRVQPRVEREVVYIHDTIWVTKTDTFFVDPD